MNSVLMNPKELAADIGVAMRLARSAQGLRQEDLASISHASLQAIKNLEAGGNVELLTFLRVASALNLSSGIMDACQPQPTSLDEVERMESARNANSRVRIKK